MFHAHIYIKGVSERSELTPFIYYIYIIILLYNVMMRTIIEHVGEAQF